MRAGAACADRARRGHLCGRCGLTWAHGDRTSAPQAALSGRVPSSSTRALHRDHRRDRGGVAADRTAVARCRFADGRPGLRRRTTRRRRMPASPSCRSRRASRPRRSRHPRHRRLRRRPRRPPPADRRRQRRAPAATATPCRAADVAVEAVTDKTSYADGPESVAVDQAHEQRQDRVQSQCGHQHAGLHHHERQRHVVAIHRLPDRAERHGRAARPPVRASPAQFRSRGIARGRPSERARDADRPARARRWRERTI